MATEFHYLEGTVNWFKFLRPDEKYDYYGMDFYPDDMEKWKASGIQLEPNTDDEGKTFFKVKRRPTALIKGELVKFGPPKVLDADDNPMNAPVGNGSKVIAKIAVYDSAKGKGHRLEAVRVVNLVEYEGGEPPEVHNAPDVPF